MHESVAAMAPGTAHTFARLSDTVDALSSAIAGFALLAGTRAFTFAALLAWREPVLGGAGLVLLALVGWLRWQCRRKAAHRIVRKSGLTVSRRQGTGATVLLQSIAMRCTIARKDSCNGNCKNEPFEPGRLAANRISRRHRAEESGSAVECRCAACATFDGSW